MGKQNLREQVTNEILREDVQLVIFDLHGTLLCTHARYSEWLDILCERLVLTHKAPPCGSAVAQW